MSADDWDKVAGDAKAITRRWVASRNARAERGALPDAARVDASEAARLAAAFDDAATPDEQAAAARAIQNVDISLLRTLVARDAELAEALARAEAAEGRLALRAPTLPTMALDDATLADIAARPTPDVTALLDEVRRLTMECDARMEAIGAMIRGPAEAWRADLAAAQEAALAARGPQFDGGDRGAA